MKRQERLIRLVYNIFRELYKQATPSADFDELVENATLNERGEKVIPFNDYEIEREKMDEIYKRMTSRKESGMILSEWEKRSVSFQVYLGCSPKTKQ